MSDTGLYFDEEEDKIIFFHISEDSDSYTINKILIDRAKVLQELLVMATDYGDFFTIFEESGEETELTFLTPPTRDCIIEEEEE